MSLKLMCPDFILAVPLFFFSFLSRIELSRIVMIYRNHCNLVFLSCRSCFELLLSVPENEIPYEAWLQFHQSVQVGHLVFQHCFKSNHPDTSRQLLSKSNFVVCGKEFRSSIIWSMGVIKSLLRGDL